MPKVFEDSGVIPMLDDVRLLASQLHHQGKLWSGEYQGWPAYYTPEDRTRKPANSKQQFYPAEFWIGTDRIWTFTMAWEDGADEEPLELESKYYAQSNPSRQDEDSPN